MRGEPKQRTTESFFLYKKKGGYGSFLASTRGCDGGQPSGLSSQRHLLDPPGNPRVAGNWIAVLAMLAKVTLLIGRSVTGAQSTASECPDKGPRRGPHLMAEGEEVDFTSGASSSSHTNVILSFTCSGALAKRSRPKVA